MCEEFGRSFVNLCARNLESNDLIWLSCKQKILVSFVEGLDPLLIR